ncbi:MAG: response regulator transcription factor [Gemmatimonadaceae bacterium]
MGEQNQAQEARESSAGEGAKSDARIDCITVLLVSDVRLMCDGLAQVLSATERIRVVGTAATRTEAVQIVKVHAPDIVLLDMTLKDCASVVQDVRAAGPAVGIVAFAVAPGDEGQLACVEAGVTGFVGRQGGLSDLVRAVECVARGEAFCTRRVVATLFRSLANHSVASRIAPPLLSVREMQVVELIDGGLSNKEIAQQLHIGLATVKNHVHHILEKLHVGRRAEAAASVRKLSGFGQSLNSYQIPQATSSR